MTEIPSDEPVQEVRARVRVAGLLPLLLFLSTFAVFAATAERSAVNTDVYAASVGAWRVASTGKPWLDGIDVREVRGTHSRSRQGTWLTEAPNGHVVAQRMAGPIIFGIPFYWVMDRDPDPGRFSLLPGALAASFLSAGAVTLMFLTLRRRAPDGLALTAALVFGLATPTWSVSANGLWTHSVTQLGIAGAAFALSRDRWWLAGVSFGVAMWGRPHLAVVAAVVGLGMLWSRRSWRPVAALALPTLVSLGLLTAWNRLWFGAWSIGGAYGNARISQVAEGSATQHPWSNYVGFLVSPDRGFLVWTPVVVMLIPAMRQAWRCLPDWSKWLVGGGLAYTLVQLRLNYFAGGEGFYGYRHGLELLTCLVPALALSTLRTGRLTRALAAFLVGLQFAAIAVGAAVEAYFLPVEKVWLNNGFWVAVRAQPWLLGSWTILCGASAVLFYIKAHQDRSKSKRPAAELAST